MFWAKKSPTGDQNNLFGLKSQKKDKKVEKKRITVKFSKRL